MSDAVVYGFPQSTYVRTVRMCLQEKGVPYDLEGIEFASDEHRALHPFGLVPAFRHGDFRLYETAAIVRYVDSAFDGPALVPDDPKQAALMAQWISAINAYVYPAIIGRCVLERFAPLVRGRDPDEATIAAAIPDIEYQLGVIDAALGDQKMLAGEALTNADLLLAPILFYAAMTPDISPLVEARVNVVRWHDEIKSRPSYRDTIPELPSGDG